LAKQEANRPASAAKAAAKVSDEHDDHERRLKSGDKRGDMT
jgi:hypothetical protein